MARQNAAQKGERRSWVLIGWAAVLFVLGAVATALSVWGALGGASPGLATWLEPAAAASASIAATALVFLVLGLFVVRLGPAVSPLSNDQKLIVRAAAAMVLADKDVFHVEIEALRVWVERAFGFQLAFDEIEKLARENASNRDAVVTAVADHHRSLPSWGKDDDEALISACVSVIVSDLRNRDEEIAYLKKLAEAVEFDKARCDRLVSMIKSLELELETLVVQALARRTEIPTAAAA